MASKTLPVHTEPADQTSSSSTFELAALIDAVGKPSFFTALHSHLARVTEFQNFIVIVFETRRTAEIIHANLEMGGLRRQMTPYLNGLYELDPFFIVGSAGDERMFFVMDEIAPEEFTQTDFYKAYYTNIDVTQETRFIVALRPGRWIHVLVERERPMPEFSQQERSALRSISQLIAALVRKHHEFSTAFGNPQPANRVLNETLREVLGQLNQRALSQREVQIAESLLQGHSPKSISGQLAISLDTVTNHKRRIYEKLGIHSQAQLFSQVLSALFGASAVPGDGGQAAEH